MDLSDKIIMITGASKGIGEQTAYKFAKEKSNLILTYFSDKKNAEEIKKKCIQLGAKRVSLIQLDLRKIENIKYVVDEIKSNFQKIDVLINNAGVISWKPLSEQTFEEISDQIKVNVEGLINLTKQLLPYIRYSIINLGSIFGKIASGKASVYSATKFAVRGFTQALAQECPDLKIFVVNPDGIATRMNDFVGRNPKEVSEVILKCFKGEYAKKSGEDIDVWEILK